MRIDDPGVADLGRALDGPVIVGGHPDRRVRLLDGTQGGRRTRQLAVAALEVDRLAGPELLDDVQVAPEPRDALARDQAEGVVLRLAVAEPDPEDEAPARHNVERGDLLGD